MAVTKVTDQTLRFEVRRRAPELIPPSGPTPHEFKELSDIDDQEGLRFQIPVIQFYKNRDHPGSPAPKVQDPSRVIKEALGRALVPYYPFAGRLREKEGRKLVVECTGEGVMFIEADANVTLDDFGEALKPPIPMLEELLYHVPGSTDVLDTPLLLIQVTRLKCGGFIVTHKMNHAIVDALGVAHFMNATSELARGAQALSVNPVWERHLLSARDPPHVTCLHPEFDRIPDIPLPDDLILKRFFFGPTEITALRNSVPPHLKSCTTFEILTAVIWRSWTVASGFNPDDEVRVRILVNARHIMKNPPLPDGYYGNVLATPNAISSAKALIGNPVGYAVELVKAAKNSVDEEYVKSMMDFLVVNGRPGYTKANTLTVSDVRRIKHDGIDFGWGPPVHYGPMKGWAGGPRPGSGSYFLRSKNSNGESGILVPMYLPALAMEMFVQEINGYLDPAFDDKA